MATEQLSRTKNIDKIHAKFDIFSVSVWYIFGMFEKTKMV